MFKENPIGTLRKGYWHPCCMETLHNLISYCSPPPAQKKKRIATEILVTQSVYETFWFCLLMVKYFIFWGIVCLNQILLRRKKSTIAKKEEATSFTLSRHIVKLVLAFSYICIMFRWVTWGRLFFNWCQWKLKHSADSQDILKFFLSVCGDYKPSLYSSFAAIAWTAEIARMG